MNLFGESAEDRRDRILGLAGLTAGVQSLRILAERGLASWADIKQSTDGIRAVLRQLPEGAIDPAQLERLDGILDTMIETARDNFKGDR